MEHKNNLLENKIVVCLFAGVKSSIVNGEGFTNPIFGAILSAVFLAEWSSISIKYVVALALVSLGIYVVNRVE